MSIIAVVLLVFALLVLLCLVWRVVSQRQSLPCPAWLSWLVELDNPFAKAHRADTIVAHLSLKPGMKVIDIGCGPGRVTLPLARAVGQAGEVAALDVQAEMLEKVRRKAHAQKLGNIRYIHASLSSDVLPKNYYDRAVLVAVLGEIPNQQEAMQEIFVALKPGGMLSVTETMFDPHYQRRHKVQVLAQEAGFILHAVHGNRLAFTMLLEKA